MVLAHQLVHLLIGMQELAGCPDLYKNTVDAWFREMAQETQKIYEAVESLKATLKAKGLFWGWLSFAVSGATYNMVAFFFAISMSCKRNLERKLRQKVFLERRKKTRTWLKVWLKAVAILFPVHEIFISILHILGRSHALLWSLAASEQKLGWRKKIFGKENLWRGRGFGQGSVTVIGKLSESY